MIEQNLERAPDLAAMAHIINKECVRPSDPSAEAHSRRDT